MIHNLALYTIKIRNQHPSSFKHYSIIKPFPMSRKGYNSHSFIELFGL